MQEDKAETDRIEAGKKPEIKVGDVVRLRSTIPLVKMTVEGFVLDSAPSIVRVVWFDTQNQLQRDRVPLSVLQLA
jgi:uncharacterized protein YodC (DUF2158 family)